MLRDWLADTALLCTVLLLVLYCASPRALPAVGFALLPAVGFAPLGSFHPVSPARR